MRPKMTKIVLYAMTAKGVAVLKTLLAEFGPDALAFVVTARDKDNAYDGADDIQRLALEAGIPAYSKSAAPQGTACAELAVSWRWLIPATSCRKLVVFHDSLLPKYRGFAPLVSALVNGEKRIGVTALLASEEYDRGPVIGQDSVALSYPTTIAQAIETIIPCYERLAVQAGRMMLDGHYESTPQDEAVATYSLWRDEDDYIIDWTWEAARVRRFVDAVGYPYKGAATLVSGKKLRLLECEEVDDIRVENRTPGKVIFIRDGEPVVVCGRGLLKITRLVDDATRDDSLPWKTFRTRFGGPI